MEADTYDMELAKSLISEYIREEFDCEADFTNLATIGIAYTTVTDAEISIQVNANLVDFRIERYLGDKLFDIRQYETLNELIEEELCSLSFCDLVAVYDDDVMAFVGDMEG